AADSWPAFSPDGRRIAFISDRAGEAALHVLELDGGGVTKLGNGVDIAPAWSPDGSTIAYLRQNAGGSDIFLVQPGGAGPTNLTEDPHAQRAPSWSPDGTRLAFRSGHDIYTLRVDGT